MLKFKGFNPDQTYKLLSEKLGYQGRNHQDEMDAFMEARPEAAVQMGKYAEMAKKRLERMGYAEGGSVRDNYIQNLTGLEPTTTTETPTTGGVDQGPFDPTKNIPVPKKKTTKTEKTPEEIAAEQAELEAARENISQITQKYGGTYLDRQTYYDTFGSWPMDDPNKYEVWLSEQKKGEQLADPSNIVSPEVEKTATTQIDPNTGQIKEPVPTVTAQQMDAAKLGEAQGVTTQDISAATVDGVGEVGAETIDPSLVGDKIDSALSGMTAATADPTAKATVQGQLEGLMADFEDGTPPWASGAMREAMGVMQARGLGASSMAGQAIVQAAMEAALPIAMADAQTYATFELTNLNNEQQTMIFKSQQRIAGILSDQAAENAAKQFNATSKMQVDQFNTSLQESVKRFNATQINAISTFNAEMQLKSGMFSAEQKNQFELAQAQLEQQARQLNLQEANAMTIFNAQMKEDRAKFESQNQVIIAQANAQLRQQTNLADTAAQNAANMYYASTVNGLTMAELDNYWQSERDLLTMTFSKEQAEYDRETQILLAKMDAKLQGKLADQKGKGALAGVVLDAGLDLGSSFLKSFF